jgi:hypothetical protein
MTRFSVGGFGTSAAIAIAANQGGLAPAPVLSGTPLRGYQISASGLAGRPVQFQERSAPGGPWSDVSLPNPFTAGAANAGRAYRGKVTVGSNEYISAETLPIGLSDSVLPPNNAYHSIGIDTANINTDGVGYNAGWVRGVDYFETIRYFRDEFGANAIISWDLKPGVGGPTKIFCYQYFSRNRATDEPAAAPYEPGVAHSNLSTQVFTWNLSEVPGSAANWNHLIEWFASNNQNLVAPAVDGVGGNREQEIGILPSVADDIRSYFVTDPLRTFPNYVDENGLSWLVRSKPPPRQVLASGNYTVAIPPAGVKRLVGNIRKDRYMNWLISQNGARGSEYMTGFFSGIENNTSVSGGAGSIFGKYMPPPTEYPWSGVAAAPYSFDPDVAAYFARYSNLQGMEVRKAVDEFIAFLKIDGTYGIFDELYPHRAGGVSDKHRAFKSASRDIVDRMGTSSYVAKQGLTYAGAGYGSTQFNPATAGGNYSETSAFLYGFIEADPGAVAASHFGNSNARFGRTTNGTGMSHQLNNAGASFLGGISGPDGYALRRLPQPYPEGTGALDAQGHSPGYQVKVASTTVARADPIVASAAPASQEFELGRAGSGSVYSSAVFSFFAFGGGLTNTQTNLFQTRILNLRAALNAAGI